MFIIFRSQILNLVLFRRVAAGVKLEHGNSGDRAIKSEYPKNATDSIESTKSNTKGMSQAYDKPIDYSTSKAKLYDSVSTFVPVKSKKLLWEAPAYQGYATWFSLTLMFIYLVFYRETNEWDENFEKKFYEGFPELEEVDLKQKIKRKQARNEDCTIEMFRLRQIMRLRQH